MSFADDLAKYCAKASGKLEDLPRKTAMQLFHDMVNPSPVDSGRFRSNWQCGLGAMNTDTSSPAGSDAINRAEIVLKGFKAGQTIWMTNSLSYARRLESGWSQQAPRGMVRLAVQDFHEAVKRAIGES